MNKQHSIIPILLFAWLSHFFVDSMLGIWSVYKTIIKFDLATAGLIAGLAAFIGEGAQVIFGSLSDKGYRNFLLMTGVGLTAASALLPYFDHGGIIFLLCLLTCMGSGAFHPPASSLVNSLTSQRSSFIMTIFASGGNLGLATSQIIFTLTYQSFGNSLILAIPPLLLIGGMLLYGLPKMSFQPKNKSLLRDCAGFFRKQPLRHLYIAQVANQSICWALVFILPDVLTTLGFEKWICFGGGHLCLILGTVLMLLPAGYLADKFSPRQVLLISPICSAAFFYFILMTGGISGPIILSSLFMLGAMLGICNPIAVSLGISLEPEKPASVSALLMGLVWCTSEVIGATGIGFLTTFFDNYAPVKALALFGIFFIVQFVATLTLKEKEPALQKTVEE